MSREPSITKVGGIYTIGRKLGCGSFGDIYLAVNSQTGEELAVKLESANVSHPMLMYEAKLIKYIQGVHGIASVHYCDVENGYNCMVMDLLGPSLEDLFNICHRKFSLKTVLMIADQMLYRIEYLHSKNFIHRDIKPDNFLMGRGKQADVVFLIDFGLAKKFLDPRSQEHIPYREDKSLTGTARYASINAHLGIEQSRRDDLEAIGYVLMYFNRSQLPWQGLQAATKEEKYQKIMECKIATSVEALCQGFPMVFASYLNYCRSLRFEDQPDYAFLRRLCIDLFLRDGFVNDCSFDWSQPMADSSKRNEDSSAPVGGGGDAVVQSGSAAIGGGAHPGMASKAGRLEGGDRHGKAGRNSASSSVEVIRQRTRRSRSMSSHDSQQVAVSGSVAGQASQILAGEVSGDTAITGQQVRKKKGFLSGIFGCWSSNAVRKARQP
eukprot:TRINITY_DN18606_c0_g1_i1.p1 TRINITY_DN18606_c0_g1~~TRINITY_DN18606_c0_g1_i1.p1  ORF type:complete len:437 (+),score=74.28 TRINITY_DN18606_c0_g1_i1:145-1455(+)